MLPLGTLSLGLWVIAVDPAFMAGHRSIKNCRIWIDQLDHLPAVMTTSFFLIFSEHPRDKLRANLRIFSYSWIIVCTVPSLTSNCALIVSIDTQWSLSMKFYIWQSTVVFWLPYSSDTSHHPSQTPCLPWISFATQKLILDSCKMLQKQSEVFHTFLCEFFQVWNRILLHIVLLKCPDV